MVVGDGDGDALSVVVGSGDGSDGGVVACSVGDVVCVSSAGGVASCAVDVSLGEGDGEAVSSAIAGESPANTSAADSAVAMPPAYQRCLRTSLRSRSSRMRRARSAFRDE